LSEATWLILSLQWKLQLYQKKERKDPHKYDTMYLFLFPKSMLFRLKIPLLEEESASSSEPTLDHPNLVKDVKQ
jgi:hypothetical protein